MVPATISADYSQLLYNGGVAIAFYYDEASDSWLLAVPDQAEEDARFRRSVPLAEQKRSVNGRRQRDVA